MAMTLRLDDELDARVATAAARKRLSKQQVVVNAVERFLREESHSERARIAIDKVIAENAGLLRRLGE